MLTTRPQIYDICSDPTTIEREYQTHEVSPCWHFNLSSSSVILVDTIHMRYSPRGPGFKSKKWAWFTPNKKTIRCYLRSTHVLISFIHWVDRTIKRVTNSPAVAHKSWIVRCIHRIFAHMYSTVSVGPSNIESLKGFLRPSPSNGVSPHFTIESLPSVPYP